MSDPLADKVTELRQRIVALIADGIAARAGTPGHHADASDLLAQYLTEWHQWWQMYCACKNCGHDSPHVQQDGDECWCRCTQPNFGGVSANV